MTSIGWFAVYAMVMGFLVALGTMFMPTRRFMVPVPAGSAVVGAVIAVQHNTSESVYISIIGGVVFGLIGWTVFVVLFVPIRGNVRRMQKPKTKLPTKLPPGMYELPRRAPARSIEEAVAVSMPEYVPLSRMMVAPPWGDHYFSSTVSVVETTVTKTVEKQPEAWTCKFCDSINTDMKRSKCENCGGPRR